MESINKELLKKLLRPPDPNFEYQCSLETKSKGFTLLMKLVLLTKEHPFINEYIKEYIQSSNELDKKNEKGYTALMLACMYSSTKSTEETVKILIDSGCDLNSKNYRGWSALMYSSKNSGSYSSENTVKLLIDAGAIVNTLDHEGWSALSLACLNDKTQSHNTLKMLINSGTDINQKITGWSILMVACRYCKYPAFNRIKILIEAGIDVNYRYENVSALMFAAIYNEDAVQLLLDNNATVTSVDLGKIDKRISINMLNKIQHHILDQKFKNNIKRKNYLNVLKFVPTHNQEIRFKHGTITQKIIKYKFELSNNPCQIQTVYENIKENDKYILDYLSIDNPNQISKIYDYIDFFYKS